MKKEAKKHIRTGFSVEDKKEYIELTFVELGKGETTKNISQDLGICEWYVQRIIKGLISSGRISEAEIDERRKEKKKRDKFQSSDIQKILEGLREGKTIAEIEKTVSYAYTGVRYNIKWLIDNGYITQEEIDMAIEERRKERDSRIKRKYLEYLCKDIHKEKLQGK